MRLGCREFVMPPRRSCTLSRWNYGLDFLNPPATRIQLPPQGWAQPACPTCWSSLNGSENPAHNSENFGNKVLSPGPSWFFPSNTVQSRSFLLNGLIITFRKSKYDTSASAREEMRSVCSAGTASKGEAICTRESSFSFGLPPASSIMLPFIWVDPGLLPC